ncbi:glucokinase [Pseudoalteromonas piratica]|uniref:Glucokinase n=1 Tax=Pseudoalteromonas piratica TaxID=1348114 RepID=A0A0A7EFM9_9GAMM|nr:glucokinase [Pseudoalteromonas piratica]AIY65419.1 glucokinase [Pseudoalteromonas piratica]
MFEPIIVADVGGTNARFALVSAFDKSTKQITFDNIQKFSSLDFESFADVLAAYVRTLTVVPKKACFAVAGPRKQDTVFLTNLGWQFNVSDIKARFGFEQFKVINDFAAFAEAAPYINNDENLVVKNGEANPHGNIAVIGPGTGFGAAALVKGEDSNVVLSCEAGHISLAACNELERNLINALSDEFEHVSVEHVFSGQGIENLYRAMAKVHNVDAKDIDAPTITSLALANDDTICVKTLTQFCDWIGAVAGDLSLTFNATGGVYIGGGILPRFQDKLLASEFSKRFVAKGKMQHIVEDIPVVLITQDNIPLLGAAASLDEN